MKKVLIGGFLFVSGILLYIGIHISTAIFMTEVKAWSTPPGRYGTALEEIGGQAEINISIILCIVGIALMMWDGMRKSIINLKRNRPPITEEPEDEKILV